MLCVVNGYGESVCVYVFENVCICVRVYVCTCVRVYVCTCVRVYVYVRVYVCTCVDMTKLRIFGESVFQARVRAPL